MTPPAEASTPIFYVHVMKTGGTSLRNMLWRLFPAEDIYPNERHLSEHGGNYPSLGDTLRLPAADFQRFRLVAGHYPYVLAERFAPPPTVLTMLRDPVARSLSHLRHIRLKRPFAAGKSLAELFDDPDRRAAIVTNYQTKCFSFRSPTERAGVNQPLPTDRTHLHEALRHLTECAVVGTAERFSDTVAACEAVLGRPLGETRTDNVSVEDPTEDLGDLVEKIRHEVELDQELYEAADEMLDASIRPGAPPGS